jgi:hypothetical protein
VKGKELCIAILILLSIRCFSQNRENVWELGQSSFPDSSHFKCGINFSNNTATAFAVYRTIAFFLCNTSICDTSGNLQFFFNGILLGNRLNQRLLNSDSINPGPLNGTQWDILGGTGILEGAITIPRPDSPSEYYIFYQNADTVRTLGFPSLHLRYSLIDMNLDSGKGAVVPDKKCKSIVTDTLEQGAIAACKHANGRDWWVVEKNLISNKYYKVLITSDSMYVSSQSIGIPFNMGNFGDWANFSPDGSKYAFLVSDFEGIDSVEVMDFDRCSGEFSNPIAWQLPNTYGVSCTFSPNSRFLYCVQNNNLYQYDTYASDIPNSLIKVDTFDGTVDSISGIPAWFAESQLAPDGKIYVGNWGSYKALAVINSPDSLGKACNFTQHSFALPYYNFCTPYYPNYDLGGLPGSDCDSLTSIVDHAENWQLKVYPDPVSQWLNIEYLSTENLQCEITDVTGREIFRFTLYPYFKNRMYNMNNLTSGIYILNVRNEKGYSVSKKIVKE